MNNKQSFSSIFFFVISVVSFSICEKSYVVPKLKYIANPVQLHTKNHCSSYPYITGDTFRAICDFIVDESRVPFFPSKVKKGDIVFVSSDYLDYFFGTVHKHVPCPYILVTHNYPHQIPREFGKYLDDNKLIAWFGHNITINHPKLFTIPLGIANSYWDHGNTTLIEVVRNNKRLTKDWLAYLNIKVNTYPQERKAVYDMFKDREFCHSTGRKNYQGYLEDLARSKFVISPRGYGLDCHRTWETMLVGSIPIVKHSPIDCLFEGLPILLIDDWSKVTEEFLHQKYEEMKHKTYDTEKLFVQYWINTILACKERVKNTCN